jgi:CheY-like chemotaxis protein
MEWITVLLILGLVVIVVVALVGGRTVIGPEGIQFDSEGLINSLQKARESRGVASPSESSLREEEMGFIRRTKKIDRTLPVATILWVDDHPVNNLFERRAFAALGIFCDSYTTNADALAGLEVNGYDLIISDIGRGDSPETGWDLLDEVRSIWPRVPFIFYTIGVDDSMREQASARGASAVEEVPDQLIATVLELLSPQQ